MLQRDYNYHALNSMGFFFFFLLGEGGGEWVRVGREAKNTSKNAIETDKQKNKRKKLKEDKMTVSQSKSSWKVSTTKSVPADK